MPWLSLASMLVVAMGQALLSPLFWGVVALVALQHYRLARIKGRLTGVPAEPLWLPVLYSTAMGVLGGLLGSVLLVLLGVSLNDIGIAYLWVLAIVLMLVSPHLLCFSYAGGLLSLSSLAFGFPRLEVPQLMGLVGALHLVESLLIRLSGHLGAIPVYLRLPGGEVAGAFNMQRFWPIPLVATAIITVPHLPPAGLEMPYWWPLIRSPAASGAEHAVYLILPVVAALGYGDLAVTSLPAAKSRSSALNLLFYSVILLGLAVGASHYPPLAVLAALFAPLGHELTIALGRRAEIRGRPLFLPPVQGTMVLDTVWGSPARRWGLRSGSIVRAVNGQPVTGREELGLALATAGPVLEMDYTGPAGPRRVRVRKEAGRPVGLILVPEAGDEPSAEFRTTTFWRRWLRHLFSK